jgi:hypothetical protein
VWIGVDVFVSMVSSLVKHTTYVYSLVQTQLALFFESFQSSESDNASA